MIMKDKILQCDINSECHNLLTCQRGLSYCDNGNCKCLTLQAMDTNRVDVNHIGECNRHLDCQSMRSCDKRSNLLWQRNLQVFNVTSYEYKRNWCYHGGICDTYLECGSMLCFDYRRGCCVNGKCVCRKQGQFVPNCPK